MVTPIFVCGAECGVDAAGNTSPAGSVRKFTLVGATASIQTGGGLTAGPHSLRSFKLNPAAGVDDIVQCNFFSTIGAPATCVGRVMVRFAVLPNAIHTIVSSSSGGCGIRYNPTGTQLEAFAGATTLTIAGAFVPVVDTWYRIDFKFVLNTTSTTDWQVNGVAQTQASHAGSSLALTSLNIGHNTVNTANTGSAATTATYYADDVCISGTGGDYPIGPGRVAGLFPTADGTHSYDAATDFLYDNSSNVNATSSLETGTWANLQNPLSVSTITHFMATASATGLEYLEWALADMSETPISINAVAIVSTHHSATAAANTQSLRIEDGATEEAVLALVAYNTTTITSEHRVDAVAPSSSAAWTLAKVNALKVRWGYSNDVAPVPFIDGVCAEVDYLGPIVLAGFGSAAAAATDQLRITARIAGHGDAASGVTNLLRVEPIHLDGNGAAASGATDLLIITARVTGNGAGASGSTDLLVLAADLRGQGTASSAGTGIQIAQLRGHGDAASADTNLLVLTAAAAGHGDAAVGGRADITVTSQSGNAVALTGQGTAASAVTNLLVLAADLRGHGDASTADTNLAVLAADLRAHGDAATTGTGQLIASLGAHGDAASTGTGALRTALALAGHGDSATAGAALPVLAAAATGHGDAASGGQGTVTTSAFNAVALTGTGAASSTGTAPAVLALSFTGQGTASSAVTNLLRVALDLQGQGTAASAVTNLLRLTAALTAHGDAASIATGLVRLTLALTGHGDAANAASSPTVIGALPDPNPQTLTIWDRGHTATVASDRHVATLTEHV